MMDGEGICLAVRFICADKGEISSQTLAYLTFFTELCSEVLYV